MAFLYAFVALMAGMLLSVQAGVNSQLRGFVGGPLRAALVSFGVGTVALVIANALAREPAGRPLAAPWWVWTGGLIGAFFVTANVLLAPRLGAGVLVGFVVAGQLLAALALDHLGLLGFQPRPASPGRLLGAALLLAGAVLIRRF